MINNTANTKVSIGNFTFSHSEQKETRITKGIYSTSGKEVIVKIFPNNSSGEISGNFLKERTVLKKLAKRAFICKPYAISTVSSAEISVIILKKYDSDLFHYAFERDISLSSHVLMTIFAKICKGVAQLHEAGVAHLDLKPENILLNHKTKDTVLCDFDHSFIKSSRRKSKLVYLGERGTEHYNAPEQKCGYPVDPFAVDVYSLGCILFVLSTGCFPKTNAYHELLISPEHNLSPEHEKFIAYLMESNPVKRPTIHQVLKHEYLQQI